MGVYVKGLAKPKTCAECPLVELNEDGDPCCMFTGIVALDLGVQRSCPVVEVKEPHGRLIDADELHRAMYHRAFETDGDTMWQSGCWVRYRAIEAVHDEQPTVIEAEVE